MLEKLCISFPNVLSFSYYHQNIDLRAQHQGTTHRGGRFIVQSHTSRCSLGSVDMNSTMLGCWTATNSRFRGRLVVIKALNGEFVADQQPHPV